MNFNQFEQIRHLLPDDRFMLCYSGYVSEDLLDAIGLTLKVRLNEHVEDKKKVKQIFSIFVELMQNLIRYGLEGPKGVTIKDEDHSGFGLVMVVEETDGFISLISGNYIKSEAVPAMQARLSKVQGKSDEELRALLKDQIRKPTEETSKGASLGLTEIARRSAKPIETSFVQSDDMHHFFMMKAFV